MKEMDAGIPGTDTYALSPLQEGMLFNSLVARHSGIDIEQIVFVLRERLHGERFQEAWDEVARRHAVLRTTFHLDDSGRPSQTVHVSIPLVITREDWSAVPPAGLEEGLQTFLREDRRRSFDLTQLPLQRVRVFSVSDVLQYVVWTFHHILLDGRSFPIIIKEVFAAYEALCEGHARLREEAPPYRSFIEWLGTRDAGTGERFWREYLRGFSVPTPLLRDAVPTQEPGADGAVHRIETRLQGTTTAALRELAGREDLTPNSFVQGAWALLLARYSGTDDVVFGATRACRHATVPGSEGMVGMFINTLPVRAKIPAGMHLLPWLRSLRADQRAFREHEHTPLFLVQRWSDIPGGEPLFDSLLVFENTSLNSSLRSQGGAWLGREFHEYERTNYPLTLAAYLEDRLLLRIVFDPAQFTRETIVRMGGHLVTLLEEMVKNPQRVLPALPMITAEERKTLVEEWNATEAVYPREMCLHELIDEQAGKSPEAVAVEFEGRQLTYGGLVRSANHLARKLVALGVGPEALVGVCMEHSPEMVIGILAVLKAGGAYVPLNPSDPAERLAFVMKETAMPVLLTQEKLAPGVPSLGVRVLPLDSPGEAAADGGESSPPGAGVKPGNAAYVIYTSGSTGTPKGVVVTHRGVVNYVSWAARAYGISPGDCSPVHSSLTFDLTVTSLFVPLVAGGKVLLLREEPGLRTLDAALSDTGGFGLVKLTPAHLDILSARIPRERMAGRTRTFVVGGEDLRAAAILPWQSSAPETSIVNEYGPTETTVGCCTFTVPRGWRESGNVPVGRPIANTQLYILDPWMNPAPALVPGELYIGGDGVAREYLRRPDLTSERFMRNPFVADPGGRMFRTGDRARYRDDGTIEFLGRMDRQVKIRGFRIEPGEIESVLVRYPGIEEAIVVAREDAPGDRRLVAYCRTGDGIVPEVNGIVSFLGERLPAYLVPSAYAFMDRIPLTPNGKLDYGALPVHENRRQPAAGFALPRTTAEEAIARIWCEVLNLKEVAVHDNFFDLGGHSLLATRIVSRVRSAWNVEMPFVSIFEHPTVEGMASVLERILTEGGEE